MGHVEFVILLVLLLWLLWRTPSPWQIGVMCDYFNARLHFLDLQNRRPLREMDLADLDYYEKRRQEALDQIDEEQRKWWRCTNAFWKGAPWLEKATYRGFGERAGRHWLD